MQDSMPVFAIKAKDDLALETIHHYQRLCRLQGLYRQADEVGKALEEMKAWRLRNSRLCHLPDHDHVAANRKEKS